MIQIYVLYIITVSPAKLAAQQLWYSPGCSWISALWSAEPPVDVLHTYYVRQYNYFDVVMYKQHTYRLAFDINNDKSSQK